MSFKTHHSSPIMAWLTVAAGMILQSPPKQAELICEWTCLVMWHDCRQRDAAGRLSAGGRSRHIALAWASFWATKDSEVESTLVEAPLHTGQRCRTRIPLGAPLGFCPTLDTQLWRLFKDALVWRYMPRQCILADANCLHLQKLYHLQYLSRF